MAFMDLFRPKWRHSDYNVRARAVEKITKPSLLVKIAKSDGKDDIPQKAVAKITDQIALAEIAQKAKSMLARLAAADKLEKRELAQPVYVEAARNSEYHFLAQDTIKKITDAQLAESINVEIASNVKFPCDCRKDAADRSADQSLLAEIAKNDNHTQVRVAAVEKLDAQTLPVEIAKNKQDAGVQKCAKDKLAPSVLAATDQATLAEVAKTHEKSSARSSAASQLTDQVLLAKIARTDKNYEVRAAAVANLDDQDELTIIAKTDNYAAVFGAAIRKLSIPTVITELAMNHDDCGRQAAAVGSLTDQSMLAEIMRETKEPSVYVEAADRLADQNAAQKLIAEIALMAKNPDPETAGRWKRWMIASQDICRKECSGDKNFEICQVGIRAVEKLTDISILADIANTATEPKLRSAAAERLAIQSAKVAKGRVPQN